MSLPLFLSSTSTLLALGFKVVVLGDSSVGKTSLVHRFSRDRFDSHTTNTIGAAFITKHHSSDAADRQLKFEIWDTAGQERYRSLTPMYYRNAKAALVCFDTSNVTHTLATAAYWLDQLSASDSKDNVRVLLIGTKQDLLLESDASSQVDAQGEIDRFLANHDNISCLMTSAKQGTGVTEIFEHLILSLSGAEYEMYAQSENIALPNSGLASSSWGPLSPSYSSCC